MLRINATEEMRRDKQCSIQVRAYKYYAAVVLSRGHGGLSLLPVFIGCCIDFDRVKKRFMESNGMSNTGKVRVLSP